jgi:hypothetical protein
MDKILELSSELANNSISKIKMRNFFKKGMQRLDTISEFLKSMDENTQEKFLIALNEKLPAAMQKSYAEGRIKESALEGARKMMIIFPSDVSKAVYEFTEVLMKLSRPDPNDSPSATPQS